MRNQWRRMLAGLMLAAVPLWAAAQPVPAAPAGHAAAAPAAHGESQGEEAKPALLQYDPGAAVWSIIIFVLLLVLLRTTAWKPLLRVLQEREEFIATSIAEAKREREQAAKLLADYQAQLDRARVEAGVLVEEGRRDADAARQRILEQARQDTAELTERARKDIQLASDAAIKDLYDRTAELATDVAGRVLRKQLTPADHTRLVAESIAEIRAGGKAKLN